MEETLKEKQLFLRENILDKGYNAEDFMNLLHSKKGESGLDLNNWTICYPYGNYNEDTIEILKKKHCQFGLTTRVDLASTDSEEEDTVFKLPRLDTNDFPRQADATTNEWFQKTN